LILKLALAKRAIAHQEMKDYQFGSLVMTGCKEIQVRQSLLVLSKDRDNQVPVPELSKNFNYP